MRILVVSQYFWPENFRINDLVARLVERGHEIVVLTGWPNYPSGKVFDEFRAQPRKFDTYAGAEVVRVPLVARGTGRGLRLLANYLSFAASASLLGAWRLRRRPFDAVFVYEPSPITVGVPGVGLGRLKRAPVTLWVLDLWPDTLAAIGVVKSPILLGLVGRLVRFVYTRCALVLVQSQAFIPAVLKYDTRRDARDRVRYFPSWAEEVYSAAEETPAPEVAWRPDLFTVLFAGNVGEAQDFPAILAAAGQLAGDRRIRWVIVGDGRAMDWVREEITRRGLDTAVQLAGRHPLERMPSFYRHASALLVSLKADPVFSLTIPGKVQSYLAAGVPIVAMLDGEGARVIREAGAGLTAPSGDSGALADAVKTLAAMSPEALAEMGARGRRYAAQEFDRDTLVRRLEEHFTTLRSTGAPAAAPGPSVN